MYQPLNLVARYINFATFVISLLFVLFINHLNLKMCIIVYIIYNVITLLRDRNNNFFSPAIIVGGHRRLWWHLFYSSDPQNRFRHGTWHPIYRHSCLKWWLFTREAQQKQKFKHTMFNNIVNAVFQNRIECHRTRKWVTICQFSYNIVLKKNIFISLIHPIFSSLTLFFYFVR